MDCEVHALRRPRRKAAIASPQRKPGTGRAAESRLLPACKRMKVEFSSVGEKYKRQYDGQCIAARELNLANSCLFTKASAWPLRGFKAVLLNPPARIPWPSRERADARPRENFWPRLSRGLNIFIKAGAVACCACSAPTCAQQRPALMSATDFSHTSRALPETHDCLNELAARTRRTQSGETTLLCGSAHKSPVWS